MTDITKRLQQILPSSRIKTRLVDLISYASDAGFYFLQPKAVVLPASEEEIKDLFGFSQATKLPLVFRGGGTSLSGQSVTDGILADLSQHWRKVTVEQNGELVRVQPGITGAAVNACLKKYSRKIGPDPSSIAAAMMGGIISNNASGMCCGVKQNAYHTLKYIRFILPDGSSFDTENKDDYARFQNEKNELFNLIASYREKIITTPALLQRIRDKYELKNTVGYSLNAFVDHHHPLDILAHIMVGAEGTLGFIAEAVLQTVPDFPCKSTAMLYFPDIYTACNAIGLVKQTGAEAVELMDRASLLSIEDLYGAPALLKDLPDQASALLVEYQGNSWEDVRTAIDRFMAETNTLQLLFPPAFTEDLAGQAKLWKLRKGMFPAVGAIRKSGTTVVLEDIAFPVPQLAFAIKDLQELFTKFGYNNAIIFGHAKDGNIHFVVTQSFNEQEEINRYQAFMDEVVELVVKKYNGSLKAEHGTGRNMAPFVATEWGNEAYVIMKALKQAVDPHNLLNPGVIINEDPHAHIKNLKPLPTVEEEVDKCIECGFCEHKCPSRDLTLTPRRRIAVRRRLAVLKENGHNAEAKQITKEYDYDGLETCAVDGLCATACPVDINTGDLVKRLRRENHSAFQNRMALMSAKNFRSLVSLVRVGLSAGSLLNKLLGKKAMPRLTGAAKKVIPAFPLWMDGLRPAGTKWKKSIQPHASGDHAVIYFPTCISRMMGDSNPEEKDLPEAFLELAERVNIEVIIPAATSGLCCGQIYSSKGFKDAHAHMSNKMMEELWKTSREGQLTIVLDVTSCTHTIHKARPVMTDENKKRFDKLKIIDSVEFLHDYVLPRTGKVKKEKSIALHPVCSLQTMHLETKFMNVARHFAEQVEWPMNAGCCGMAGDRGFLYPELTKSATFHEASDIKPGNFEGYYSSARTCELAVSQAVKKNYQSILYLANKTMTDKNNA